MRQFLASIGFLFLFFASSAQLKQYITHIDTAGKVIVNGGTTTILKADDIAITWNYKIIPYIDTIRFKNGWQAYELRPLQGVWYKPFCAYPLDEEDSVKGSLIPNFNSMVGLCEQTNGTATSIINGKTIIFKIWTTPGVQSTKASGQIFDCLTKPSILIIGDLSDTSQRFGVRL